MPNEVLVGSATTLEDVPFEDDRSVFSFDVSHFKNPACFGFRKHNGTHPRIQHDTIIGTTKDCANFRAMCRAVQYRIIEEGLGVGHNPALSLIFRCPKARHRSVLSAEVFGAIIRLLGVRISIVHFGRPQCFVPFCTECFHMPDSTVVALAVENWNSVAAGSDHATVLHVTYG